MGVRGNFHILAYGTYKTNSRIFIYQTRGKRSNLQLDQGKQYRLSFQPKE